MQIVTIGKRRYAAGLWWQVPDKNLDRSLMLTFARNMASSLDDENYNAVVLSSTQFALCSVDAKFSRLPALATALIENAPENWIGRFNFGDFWWICSVHNRLVVADGDVIATEEGEASRIFSKLRAKVPAAEQILCNTPDESIAWISERLSRKAPRLRPLYGRPASEYLPRVLIGGLLLWGVVYGIGLYQEKLDFEHAMQAQQRAAHSKHRTAEMHREIKAHPERYFPQTWRSEPSAIAMAEACLETPLPLYSRGWSFVSRTCSNALASDVTRAENDEKAADNSEHQDVNTLEIAVAWGFADGASFIDMPENAVADPKDPRRAVSVASKQLHTAKRDAIPLLTQQDASARLYELANRVSGQLSVRWFEAETTSVGAQFDIPAIQITSPWVAAEWTITGAKDSAPAVTALPQFLRSGLPTAIPGLVLTEITQSLNTWTYKGVVYAYL